jgi:PBP1b-binding outer membrane lipoprotein LpoB
MKTARLACLQFAAAFALGAVMDMTGSVTAATVQPPPSPISSAPVIITEGPRRITLSIDARDYEEIATQLSDSILGDTRLKLDGTKVVAIGPVMDDDCLYSFDRRTFQEKLQVIAQRSGKLQFSFAVDSLGADTAALARYNIMRLQFEKESAVSKEDLLTFGQLANVDYLLFGRVSVLIADSGGNTEITYTYNWKLGDCKTGLLVWTDEKTLTKRGIGPAIPEWITSPRQDSPSFLYALGHGERAGSASAAQELAAADGRLKCAQRLNTITGLAQNEFILPFKPQDIEVEQAPYAQFQRPVTGGFEAWALVRISTNRYNAAITNRQYALQTWTRAELALSEAKQSPTPDQKRRLQRLGSELLRELAAKFPLGGQNQVQTEFLVWRLAELEQERGYPCKARDIYESLRSLTSSNVWKTRAAEAMAKIVCNDDARKIETLKNEFDGKTVAILAAQKLDGKIESWPAMQSAMDGLFGKNGAVSRQVPITAEMDAQMTADTSSIQLPAEAADVDLLWLVCADGKITKGDPSPMGGIYSFTGTLRGVALSNGKVLLSFADQGGGMKFPMPQMCMDSLANGLAKHCYSLFAEKRGLAPLP